MNIPLLGLGTWGMGGRLERDESNKQESIQALKTGLDLGFRLIDTAEIYAQGLSEEIVGEAIKNYQRQNIFITTKVWQGNLHYKNVLSAAKQSLARLQTNYVDLYLIHWPNENIPLSESMSALEKLVDNGLVKHIGVSNFSVDLMQKAQKCLDHTKISANQIEYNLINRSAEQVIIPFCKQNDIKVIAYCPLAKGALTDNNSNNKTLQLLAVKYKKTPTQIALNWLISQNIVAIPKAINRTHMEENLGALGWKLERGDVKGLKKI
ncbi:MAG: aldo/keto reductase [Candidatus Falkowbacteria bacterium]